MRALLQHRVCVLCLSGALVGIVPDVVSAPAQQTKGQTTEERETAVLRDIRAVLAAQTTFQSYNFGEYTSRLGCLVEPASCLPGHPEAPQLLSAEIASLVPIGRYRRSFSSGSWVPRDTPAEAAASSVSSYVYTAVPEEGAQGRAFCADDSGRICATSDGSAPRVERGRCVATKLEAQGPASAGPRGGDPGREACYLIE
jgi:hypothetical protein